MVCRACLGSLFQSILVLLPLLASSHPRVNHNDVINWNESIHMIQTNPDHQDPYDDYLFILDVFKKEELQVVQQLDDNLSNYFQGEEKLIAAREVKNMIQAKEIKQSIQPYYDRARVLKRKLTQIRRKINRLVIWQEKEQYDKILALKADIGERQHDSQNGANIPMTRSVTSMLLPDNLVSHRFVEQDCEFTFDGVDEFSGSRRIALHEEVLFSHTDDRLKQYLKNRDFISCSGFLSSLSGGYRFLTLEFTINSRNAKKEYGYISSGALLNLRLINGETISLFSQNGANGSVDQTNGKTTYRMQYAVDYQKQKSLQKSPLDKIRVVWSTGYEDYDVHHVNFFIHQFQCLE